MVIVKAVAVLGIVFIALIVDRLIMIRIKYVLEIVFIAVSVVRDD